MTNAWEIFILIRCLLSFPWTTVMSLELLPQHQGHISLWGQRSSYLVLKRLHHAFKLPVKREEPLNHHSLIWLELLLPSFVNYALFFSYKNMLLTELCFNILFFFQSQTCWIQAQVFDLNPNPAFSQTSQYQYSCYEGLCVCVCVCEYYISTLLSGLLSTMYQPTPVSQGWILSQQTLKLKMFAVVMETAVPLDVTPRDSLM